MGINDLLDSYDAKYKSEDSGSYTPLGEYLAEMYNAEIETNKEAVPFIRVKLRVIYGKEKGTLTSSRMKMDDKFYFTKYRFSECGFEFETRKELAELLSSIVKSKPVFSIEVVPSKKDPKVKFTNVIKGIHPDILPEIIERLDNPDDTVPEPKKYEWGDPAHEAY